MTLIWIFLEKYSPYKFTNFEEYGVSQVALVVKNLPPNARDIRDLSLIPGLGRSAGGGYTLQYYCLENPTDRGAWWATVQGVAKSQT